MTLRLSVMAAAVLLPFLGPGQTAAESGSAVIHPPAFTMWTSIHDVERERAFLLDYSVQRDLKLNDSVVTRIQVLYDAYDRARQETLRRAAEFKREGKQEEFEAARLGVQKVYDRFESESLAALTPDQQERLYQLTIQKQGANLLTAPMTAARLHLTAEQVGQYRKLFRDSWMQADSANKAIALDPRRQHSEAEVKAYVAHRDEIARLEHDQVRQIPGKILTKAQLAQWNTLGGAPLIRLEPPTDRRPGVPPP